MDGVVPTNDAAPTVSGDPVEGQVLTAGAGTWVGAPVSFAYRWLRGAVEIGGATAPTYVLQAGDVGSQVRVGVIATNATGSSTEALSLQTALVTAGGDTTAPTLTGALTIGTVTSSSIQITWPAGADDTAVTSYETSPDGSTWTDRGAVLTYTFTGLTASTAYTLRVRAKDAAGNVSTPALSVTQATSATPTGPDTTAPTLIGTITTTTPTTSSYTATCPAATDDTAVTGYQYRLNAGAWLTITAGGRVVNINGRTASTTDTLEMRAFDAAGNYSEPLSLSVTLAAPVPTNEPVTLEEAKLAARVDADETSLDLLITGLISSAREQAEQVTGRSYVQATTRREFTDWPTADQVLHTYAATACAITWWDGAAWQTLDGAAFVFAPAGSATVVAPAVGASWPPLGAVAVGPRVRIDLTAGPADPSTAPDLVKLYIKAMVAGWVNNPDAVGRSALTPNPMFASLLDREILF